MSGGGNQQTTQSSSEPWAPAQPYLQQNMKLAGRIGPSSFQPYQGSTVVPFAKQTLQGMDGIQSAANQNSGGRGISGQYQRTINNGGMFGGQRSANNVMASFARGGGNQSQQPFNSIANQAQGTSFSENNLSGFASGDMIGKSNPYFEDALRIASDRTSDAVNNSAASMGRYGSGAHTQTLAREIGDMQTTARAGQVNNDLDRMMSANTMIDGQRMAGLGMGLNAAQAGANVGFQNTAQRMQAAGDLFNMGQQNFNNLGTAFQGRLAPSQALMGIGASYEDLMGRQINDQIRMFEGNRDAPMQAIQFRNAIASGAGSLGGTSNSTAQGPSQNPFATALGYGLTGAGALGSFF